MTPIQRLIEAAKAVLPYLPETEARQREPKMVHAVYIQQTQAQRLREAAERAEKQDAALTEFHTALAAVQSAPAGGGWIECAQRMPEDGDSVLVYSHRHGMDMCEYMASGDLGKGWRGGDYILDLDEITHWLTLPQPPKATT